MADMRQPTKVEYKRNPAGGTAVVFPDSDGQVYPPVHTGLWERIFDRLLTAFYGGYRPDSAGLRVVRHWVSHR
jgi:hypothetical protein